MSTIKFIVHDAELGCKAELSIDLNDQDPGYWDQFDSRGEGIEQLVIEVAEQLGKRLRTEYDKRDEINKRVTEIGHE